MSHRNSRLTPHGRRLLVERVRHQGMPVAHVAKAMGVSLQCAHRWVARFDAEGLSGLEDRSSQPHHSPRRTDEATVALVLEARRTRREGPVPLSYSLGIAARTISRILAREGVPRISECALQKCVDRTFVLCPRGLCSTHNWRNDWCIL